MENLVWVIYFIDVICTSWVGVGSLLVLAFGGSLVCFMVLIYVNSLGERRTSDDEDFKNFASVVPLKTIMVTSGSILFLGSFIPSEDTAFKMLAAYGVSEVAQNEDVQNLMGDGLDILKITLKQYKDQLEVGEEEK